MKMIIFATGNKDKMREIREILSDALVEIRSMEEIGFYEEIEENGTTFIENATIKAKAVAQFTQKKEELKQAIVLADDSGLEIDYLNKEPGVYSHRWLGNRTYTQAMTDLIEQMHDVPEEKRSARFVCSIAAVLPNGECLSVLETVEGKVAHEISGENGFGYDPFFYVESFGCTTAQLTREQKNEISHRGKALRAMKERLMPYLNASD
ncbi:MAG TPA: RdgB/HAM1 family non-canonical purine NTP pyrophosphatase [Lachnospiraceae bacterium]|nr:RdgB/HAM1 family non-canonical purine NTP pyrophosphatase [Lachnospiraceae bacterium]HPF29975.1 RdgB/HAM1 family non-canonical purine NTP pyrophosphatase [Lachnospiraceae bacterium]